VLLEVARVAPRTREALSAIRGVPRGSLESRVGDMLGAVERGLAVPDAALPRFPRAPRWDRDPDFDDRVNRLRAVRDRVAGDLGLDPGVLCARDRIEAVARRNPRSREELDAVGELRRWQADVLGDAILDALRGAPGGSPTPARPRRPRAPPRRRRRPRRVAPGPPTRPTARRTATPDPAAGPTPSRARHTPGGRATPEPGSRRGPPAVSPAQPPAAQRVRHPAEARTAGRLAAAATGTLHALP
jgi:hypothetical protein